MGLEMETRHESKKNKDAKHLLPEASKNGVTRTAINKDRTMTRKGQMTQGGEREGEESKCK